MEESTSIMRYVAGSAAALLLIITCGAANAQTDPVTGEDTGKVSEGMSMPAEEGRRAPPIETPIEDASK